jgi:hypothetical protein
VFGAGIQDNIFLSLSFFSLSAEMLLEGNCRIECVEELKMPSLQLQVTTVVYNACGFFSLNLNLSTTVVGVMASYTIIMLQMK